MTKRTHASIALPLVLLLSLSVAVPEAQAHEIETQISASGVDALGPAIASQIPEVATLPTIETSLFECSGEDASIAIQSRDVALAIHDLALSQTAPGQLELNLQFSASTTGEVDFHRVVFCGSTFTCQDSLSLENVGARVLLETQTGSDGLPSLEVVDVQLDIDSERFELTLSGCDYADLANTLVDLFETVGVSMLANLVENLVRDNLAPAITNAASGISDSSLNLLRWQLEVAVGNLDLSSGIRVLADADLVSDSPVASCLQDPGEPQPIAGTPPVLTRPTDLKVSINLGLVDDLLYHMWASASQCPGLTSDAQFIGDYLGNLPVGTEWQLRSTLRSPPHIEAASAEEVSLEVVFSEIELELVATLPNGDTRRANVGLDARASVELGVKTSASAIALGLHDARVTRLVIDDEFNLAAQGFDAAHLTQFLNDVYLPEQLASFLDSEVLLPLSFGFGRTHVIVREIRTSSAYLSLGLDFFVAPTDDNTAPDTEIIAAPMAAVRHSQAFVYLSGSDSQIPTELLRYQVEVNGVAMPMEESSRIQVGLQNHTASYSVAVAAVDLAGNVDPSPEFVELLVDGIRPTVEVEYESSNGGIDLRYRATDDRTDSSRLRAHVLISDAARGTEVETRQLPAGASSLSISTLDPEMSYRITVVVVDEVGNEGASSFVIPAAQAGGCSTAGGAASSGAVLLLLFCLAGIAKSRRYLGLVVLIALPGAACASADEQADEPTAIMLPECASDLAVQMWTEMQAVSDRSTISMTRAVGHASRVDPNLYIDGPEIFGKWAALIEQAELEVDMQFYKWEPETDATETILAGIRALQDRRRDEGASEAIVVRIVIDTSALGVAAPATEEHMPWVMERIEAYELDPRYIDLRFFVVERGFLNQFGNLHVKTMVVDGRVAIITGANPEHQHDFDQPWHDLATVFYGDIVGGILDDIDFTHKDAQRWTCSSHSSDRGACLVASEPFVHRQAQDTAPLETNTCAVLALSRTPSVTANNAVDNPQDQAFLAAFNGATRVIKIETPNINDDAVKTAILDAVKRGVEVRLITSKEFNESSEGFVGGPNGANVAELYRDLALLGVSDPCSKLQARWYSRDGLEPIVGNGAYASHTKYSSVDDQIVIVGTTNMDTASWNFSHELNLAIDDNAMAQKLNAQLFDADWGKAVVVEECRDF